MTDHDRTLLMSFLTQRHEMGEREWCIDSAAITTLVSPRESSATVAMRSSSDKPTVASSVRFQKIEPREGDTAGKSVPSTGGATSPPPASGSLAELNAAVSDCQRCKLGETRNQFVFGAGDPHAGILFIGEAPGADEDRTGQPFVGRAGQLLTKMIESIKLRREDVFIANILKCRPPGNRDPRPDEIEQCEPILLRQIELIKPRIICALGRISGQTLLRSTASLGSLRGRVHDYHGVKLIVTYHPAALLRNSQWKRPAWDDLKFLRREYDGLEL